jgi:NAD(P)-dependent dehydrogenase (short-subunit alcohol dehydrogenase family)
MGTLDGKVALVTGAGQGVGRGVALALASEGCAVVAAGRTVSKLRSVCAEAEARGARALAIGCDVGVAEQIDACVARAAAVEWGPAGIRVNAIIPLALSPGMEGWIRERPEESRAFLRTIPLGRVGDLERDVGRAVVVLVGPDLGYLTGTTLMLDGGQAYLR